jgi:hypothetical protein
MAQSTTTPEVWLRSNRRVLVLALVLPVVCGVVGGLLALGERGLPLRVVGGLVAASGLAAIVAFVRQLSRARVAYHDGNVLFNLRSGPPVAVPREVVEAFFLGQGPAELPHVRGRGPETVNLVARLSQKAPQWKHVAVKPALGQWCDHYVTIRGTWCEPLTGDVIRRLNARLRELRTEAQAAAALPAIADAPPGANQPHREERA